MQFSRLVSLPSTVRSQVLRHALRASSWPVLSTLEPREGPELGSSRRRITNGNSPVLRPSSVDHTEVSHFNGLASSWWDPHGPSRLLHLMNPLRHHFIRRCLDSHIRDPNRKLTYLDIGCGGGIFAESAARLPSTTSVTAVDPTPDVIAVAKRHQCHDPLLLEPDRLTYLNTAVEDLPLPASPREGHDMVTLFEVLEHIKQPAPFLSTVLAHLKPGGWLIGSTIARTNVSWMTTKLIAEDILRLVPRGTHDWNQYIQPRELQEWARGHPEMDAQWKGWQVMGVVYVPLVGWKEVPGSEEVGNYFFGIRKKNSEE